MSEEMSAIEFVNEGFQVHKSGSCLKNHPQYNETDAKCGFCRVFEFAVVGAARVDHEKLSNEFSAYIGIPNNVSQNEAEYFRVIIEMVRDAKELVSKRVGKQTKLKSATLFFEPTE